MHVRMCGDDAHKYPKTVRACCLVRVCCVCIQKCEFVCAVATKNARAFLLIVWSTSCIPAHDSDVEKHNRPVSLCSAAAAAAAVDAASSVLAVQTQTHIVDSYVWVRVFHTLLRRLSRRIRERACARENTSDNGWRRRRHTYTHTHNHDRRRQPFGAETMARHMGARMLYGVVRTFLIALVIVYERNARASRWDRYMLYAHRECFMAAAA